MSSDDCKQPLERCLSNVPNGHEASLAKEVVIEAVRRGHLVTLRLCVPESWETICQPRHSTKLKFPLSEIPSPIDLFPLRYPKNNYVLHS